VVKNNASGVLSGGNSVSLTADVTGTLSASNGGTGQSSYAIGDLLYASTTTALSRLAGVATGNVLISGGVGVAPSWGKVGLTTHVSGILPVTNGGTGVSSLTANALLLGGSTVSALSGTLAGQIATWNGTTWVASAPATSGTVTSVSSSTTLSGLSLTTTNGTTTPEIALTGTLGVGGGGTGLSALTAGSYVVGNGGLAATLKTPTQVTADLNVFTSTLKGLAPLSGGGTTNFLRADGTWAAPTGTPPSSYYISAEVNDTASFTISGAESSFTTWASQNSSSVNTDGTLFTPINTSGNGYYLLNISGLMEVVNIGTAESNTIKMRIRSSKGELSNFFVSPCLPVSSDAPKFINGEKIPFSHTAIVLVGTGTDRIWVTRELMGGGNVLVTLQNTLYRKMSITLTKI
jgi:hypothetical protein